MTTKKRTTEDSSTSDGRSNKHREKKKSSTKSSPANSSDTGQYVVLTAIILGMVAFGLKYALPLLRGHQVNEIFDDIPLNLSYSTKKWGSLRPGIYFGLKSMSPESIATGLLWFENKLEGHSLPIRHECNQWDKLSFYSWLKHDFESFGTQKIVDGPFNITTSFVIHDEESWSAEVTLEKSNSSKVHRDFPLSLVFYAALDQQSFDRSQNDSIEAENATFPLRPEQDFIVKGWTKSNDFYEMRIQVEDGEENVIFKSFTGAKLDPPLLNVKETILKNLAIIRNDEKNLFVLRGDPLSKDDNFVAFQILVGGRVTFRIDFSAASSDISAKEKVIELQDFSLDSILSRKHDKFDDDFERVFRLKNKGFNEEQIEFAQAVFSNLIGGIGYFNGYAKVASGNSDRIVSYGPLSLLSAVPSRPFFPRGFLWDEGFHQLLIGRFSPHISVNIITSWLSLINKDGWIPREVILGPEAESRVPSEFVVQRDVYGNPPTLFLLLESLLDQGSVYSDDLKIIFPRLQAWFSWFNRTQVGPKEGTYRWRGRDPDAKELNPKTLTSGLDDFPRASHPDSTEYHIDLRCWMTLASRVMTRISRLLRDELQDDYSATANFLSDNRLLDSLHWSDEHKMYCDFGFHSKRVELIKKVVEGKEVVERKVFDEPIYGCVPEQGYVSLFPLLLQVLEPNNPKLGTLLDSISDPKLFWTDYGLRSLSTTSYYYKKYNTEHDAPYWRANIWMNINYLTLKALDSYANKNGPYQEKARTIYTSLRNNIVENMFQEFKRTGYVWENYADDTGRGQFSHPFTGWSALVVLIMSEKY